MPTPMATFTPTPTSTPSPTPTSTPLATPVSTPESSPIPRTNGSEIRIVSPVAPPHFDVHQDAGEALASLGPGLAYSRLLRFKSGPEVVLPSMEVECDLCQSWRQVTPTMYEFTLRKSAYWHDIPPVNGRKVTAQDVVFSLERLRTPGWPNASLLDGVDLITAVDEETVKITLKQPDADFPRNLADGHAKIVAPEAVALHGDLKGGPIIGSGPWIWDGSDTPGDSHFRANPTYFEEGLPLANYLSIHVVPKAETAFAALVTKVVDLARVEPEEWSRLEERGLDSILAPRIGSGVVMGLNTMTPPFDKEDVRRAFFLALNPWKGIEDVWVGQGMVSLGLPVASSDWLLDQGELQPYFAAPAQARLRLDGAGLRLPLHFELTVADFGDRYLEMGQLIKRQLMTGGFSPEIRVLNPREYAEQVWDQRQYTAFVGPLPTVSTTNGFLFAFLHSEGRWNVTGHTYPLMDRLIQEQSREADAESRGALVREIQRFVLEKGLLFMPVVSIERWSWWLWVMGFHPNWAGSEYFFWARVEVADKKTGT